MTASLVGASRLQRWLQAAVRVQWLYLLPALLAGMVLKFLVPPAGQGLPGVVEQGAHGAPVVSLALLFLLFSALAHYWRFHLPGAAFAAAAPSVARPSARRTIATAVALGALLGAILLLRRSVVEPYEVLSGSMLPTFETGDRIAANKLAYRGGGHAGRSPSRGDIVVFHSSAVALGPGRWPDMLVKRVIGLPGDRVEMQGGSPVINGWNVPSCSAGRYLYVMPDGAGDVLEGTLRVEFLGDRAYTTVRSVSVPRMQAAYVVPPGEVFVLGDNRLNSVDSRSWNAGRGGGVPLSAVEGRAQWFLVGTHRSGDADFGRFLRPVDALERQTILEGVDATSLQQGIARCMRERPTDTTPPPPAESSPRGQETTGT